MSSCSIPAIFIFIYFTKKNLKKNMKQDSRQTSSIISYTILDSFKLMFITAKKTIEFIDFFAPHRMTIAQLMAPN